MHRTLQQRFGRYSDGWIHTGHAAGIHAETTTGRSSGGIVNGPVCPGPCPGTTSMQKDVYRDRYGRKMKGLYPAVAEAGLDWIGTHHRGIDDARNLGRLLRHLYVN